jgi:hypothetical protein
MKSENKLFDIDIRQGLHAEFLKPFHKDKSSRVIDEFIVGTEDARIDIAAINRQLYGYEIKSDADSLSRLSSQVYAYNHVFDFLYLVVGEKYKAKATEIIPSWWGIIQATRFSDKVCFLTIREAQQNLNINALSLANLLWQNEALDILKRVNPSSLASIRSRTSTMMQLVEVLSFDELHSEVRQALKIRKDLRSDSQQIQYADLRRSGPKSLDFRVKNLDRFLSQK